MATHKDPAYLGGGPEIGIEVSPISGDAIRQLIDKIAKTARRSAQADREADRGRRRVRAFPF